MITKLHDLIEISLEEIEGELPEHDCNFCVRIDGKKYNVYTAVACNREVSLYTDKGVIIYDVNNYGSGDTLCLFDIIEDEE